ncbi:MAG: ABC transporter permease subunit [Propionibacteriales bacterium]|nr:ABC transporter permease subunit [Propionibacteriales bacterium]
MSWRSARARLDTRASPYAFVAPFFLVFAVFGAFPLVYTFWVSLHDWQLVGTNEWAGLANYRELLTDSYFWNALLNTLGMFVLMTVPQLLLALALAQVLNRRLRMRMLFRVGVLIPNITSIAAVGIIFGLIFARDFGFANWLLSTIGIDAIDWRENRFASWVAISVMVDWRWTGYNALILLAALQSVPRSLYESAAMDGASAWRQFWSITVPMLRPTLIFVTIVATIGGIQLFTEPLLFNSGSNAIAGGTTRQFQTIAMYLVEQAFTGQEFGYAAAVAWVLFVIIAVVSAINLVLLRRIKAAD